MSILQLENVGYTYDKGKTWALRNINFSFDKGKMYVLTGLPNSGKTTLLSLLAGLDMVTEGKIYFDGKDLRTLDPYIYRSKDVGVIFRSYNLLPHLTALENVIFSMTVAGHNDKNIREQALEALKKAEVPDELLNTRVSEMTFYEQSKVAIARAIACNPQVILADEPARKFPYKEEAELTRIFQKLAHEDNKCVIVSSLSQDMVHSADVVYELKIANQDEEEFVKDKYIKFYKILIKII